MLQQPEDRLGNEPQNAVVHSQFQTWGQLFQYRLAFRAGIQRGAGFSLGTWSDGQRRASKTNDVVALAVFAGLNQVGFTLVRDPCGHEVVLQPGDPSTLDCFFQRALVDVFHRHFFVRLATCPQGGAQVSRGAGGSAGRRIGAVVTLKLGKQVARPRFGAFVVDQVSDLQVVQTTGEAETLDVIDAVVTEFQVNVQLVLAISQLISLLFGRINRTTGSTSIRTVSAGQATLGQINTFAAIIEQLERNIRMVLATWIQRQFQLRDITTLRVDSQVEHIRFYVDEVFVSDNRRFYRGAGIGIRAGYIGTGGRIVTQRGVRNSRSSLIGSNILSRQGSLAIVLVPLKNHDIGHDCQGDDQDRAFNIHDYSAIEEEREVGIGGTGSKPPGFHG